METIKSLVYLDEYKMYSLSSQMFGGLTESLTNYRSNAQEVGEQQTDPSDPSRLLAGILSSETATQERKYLHDHLYSRFESELKGSGKILAVSQDVVNEIETDFSDVDFVAVRGRVQFLDTQAIESALGEFNAVGEAITYVSKIGAFPQETTQVGASQSKGRQAANREQATILTQVRELAKAASMRLDPTYLEKLREVLRFGYKGLFDVCLSVGPYTFSATLRDEYFREPKDLLVKRYSRSSEREFVLVGIVTQGVGTNETTVAPVPLESEGIGGITTQEPGDLKEAMFVVNHQLQVLETTFVGKKGNEIIVDPIALYREV